MWLALPCPVPGTAMFGAHAKMWSSAPTAISPLVAYIYDSNRPFEGRGSKGRILGCCYTTLVLSTCIELKDHLVISAFCEVLRLVRLRLYALALGLGLVFSEVCTPLTTQCLCAPLLYIKGACSLARPYQLCLWCGRHRVPKRTRPAVVHLKA
jgi:hypothetical protein